MSGSLTATCPCMRNFRRQKLWFAVFWASAFSCLVLLYGFLRFERKDRLFFLGNLCFLCHIIIHAHPRICTVDHASSICIHDHAVDFLWSLYQTISADKNSTVIVPLSLTQSKKGGTELPHFSQRLHMHSWIRTPHSKTLIFWFFCLPRTILSPRKP